MIRVLVTGAAGFIGANVLFELTQRPDITPLAFVRPRGDHTRLKYLPQLETRPVDLANPADVGSAVSRMSPDIIINAAAYGVAPDQTDPAQSSAVNLRAVEALLAACGATGVRRFIQLGSFFEYGDQATVLHEDGPLAPKNAYAATKAAASKLVAGRSDVNGIVLRLFNVWGRWEKAARLVPQIIDACRTKTHLALTTGIQQKDFVYAGDAAAWICDLALDKRPIDHRIVNLASGTMMSVKDFATTIADTLGCADLLQFGAKPMPATEPQSGPADTARIDALLPDRRRTSIKDALAEVMAAS